MKALIKAIAAAGAVMGAGPAAGQDAAARLDALTCSELLGLGAEDQMNVMLVLRAHLNGDPLLETPLPVGLGGAAGGGGA